MSAGVYRTDAANELREDLLDMITDLSPIKTPLFNGLGKSVATANIHQWLNDSISRESSVSAAAEGAELSYSDLDGPDRSTNFVQEIVQPYKVSRKAKDSDLAGYSDPEAFHAAKAMKQWKLKAEYALIYGSGISGASGVAWSMSGFKKVLTTNYVSYASGTSLTEDRFNDILELPYDNVEDDTYEAYMSIGLKRRVSSFVAGSTKFTKVEDRRLINAVDVYESDAAGLVKLFAHRDISNAQNFMFVIQPKAFKIAFLAAPSDNKVAPTGPFSAGYIYGSLTLEYRQQAAGVQANGLVR